MPSEHTVLTSRRSSRQINVGGVLIGGGAPLTIQSMTKTDTRDPVATLAQVCTLADAGCDIIRLAVPDMDAAKALGAIVRGSPIPIVADIHFNHLLALEAIQQGVKKIRLNPGNLRRPEEVKAVATACSERGIPIRIGVNAGSVSPEVRARFEHLGDPSEIMAQAMVASAFEHAKLLEDVGFRDIAVSLKAFDVSTTLRANRLFTEQSDYPLHVGITEAGRPPAGLIRSCVGLGILLSEGIGDTLRVSLTANPAEEVRAGREILTTLGMRCSGLVIVSCPTCGRCEVDLSNLATRAEEALAPFDTELRKTNRQMRVAIMGCVVNGPGEAREADVGLAAGKGKAALFAHGQPVRTVAIEEALEALVAEVKKALSI
jgi:(E)-4-hydroxy-3-methylbut-2-enyl-diphosphate synthase